MSSKESANNGHGTSVTEQKPGPSSTAAEEQQQQTKNTTPARSPALHFNAGTPSSSAATATELSSPAEQQQRSAAAAAQAPPSSANGGEQQQQQQQHYQRWPGDVSGSSPAPPPPSSAAPPGPAAPVLVSPHYSLPPHIQQQHQQYQQQLYYGHQGTPPAGSQHSPGQQRHYAPAQPPQMLHPGMMYPHHPHMVPAYQQQYGAVQQQQQQAMAAAAAAYWARANGQQQQHYAAAQQQQQMPPPPPQQDALPSAPSSSARHTPQPSAAAAAPPPNPSPVASVQPPVQSSPSTAASAHGAGYDESAAAGATAHAATAADSTSQQQQRPRSRQQNQHQQQQNPAAPQSLMLTPQAAAHLRYSPAGLPPGMAMMVPSGPHGQQQPFPSPMGPPSHPQHMAFQMHHHYPAQGPPPPFPGPPPHPGIYFHHPAVAPGAAGASGVHPQPGLVLGLKPAQREAVEKLVMQLANTKQQLTADLVHERRLFFERLVLLNEQQGEVLSGPPQVSKSTVDLFSLYFAVKKKGGFEKTIKDKVWKHMCVEANADMQESSAAGFQLRKHYQKFLLKLECLETGQNAKELVEFAEKQKKKKKEKEPSSGGGAGSAGGPSTPSSSKDEQQQQQQQGASVGRPSSARGEHRDGAAQQQRQKGGTPNSGGTNSSTGSGMLQQPQQQQQFGGGQQQQQDRRSGKQTHRTPFFVSLLQQPFPAASLPPPHCWWTVGSRGGGATAVVAVQQQQQQDELAAKGGITTTTAAARMSPSTTALAFGNGGRLLLHTPSPSSSTTTTTAAAATSSTASTLSPAGTMCYVGGGGGGVARERSLLPFQLNPARPSSNPATALTNWHYQQPKQFQQTVPSYPRYGGQPPYPTTNAAAASVAIGSDYLRNVPTSSWSVLPNYPTMSPHLQQQQQQQQLQQLHQQHYAMPTSSVRVVQPQRHQPVMVSSTAASSLMGRHYHFYASAYRNHPSFASSSSSSPLSLCSPVSVAAAQPFFHQKTVVAMPPSAQYPPAYRPSLLVSSHHNSLQNYYGLALPFRPPLRARVPTLPNTRRRRRLANTNRRNGPAFQQQQQQQAPQGMYPPRMAPPPQQMRQQQQQQMTTAPQQFGTATAAGQADDEQQQQQQRLQSTSASSRLSTPVPQTTTTDQRPISRASSSSTAPPVEQQQQQQRTTADPQQDERGEGAGGTVQQQQQQQQQQRQAQTPSAFSANAPTPPLTTSTATSVQLTPSVATATAAGVVPFYHPNVPPYGVGRFPSSANEAMYGTAAGPYTSSQQPLPFAHQQQQRYQQQQAAAAAAVGRYYPPLSGASSAASASIGTPQSAKSGASSTPKGFPNGQQQQIVPSAFYASGNRASATALLGVVPPPPAGILPSSIGGPMAVPPAYGGQQQQQQPLYAMPTSSTMAWHAAVFQQHHQFPPHSLEAHTIAQVQQQTKRQRDKVYARDLWGATPARIVMALRSALHTETVWALNALNVQLYDDTSLSANAAPSLAQTPELLNLLVDHLAATLSLLFPDHFDTKTFGGRGQHRSPNSNHRISSSNATAAAATSSFCSANGICAAATNSSSSNGSSLLVPKHESLVLFDKVEVLVPNLPLTTTPRGTFVMTPNGRPQQHRQQQQPQQNGIICTTTNNSNNFTMVSRLGRRVKLDSAAGEVLPPALVRELQNDGEAKDEEVPFLHFVERVRQSVLGNVRGAGGEPRRRANGFGSKANGAEEERKQTKEFWEKEKQQELKKRGETAEEIEEESAVPRRARLFLHRADDGDDSCSCNRWHINNSKCNGSEHFTLLARPVVLQDAHADERMGALMEQCLALANILRGYAFLPGHERTLGAHGKLLRLLSVLMMLMVDGTERKRKTNTEQASRGKQHHSPDIVLKMKDEETEQKHLAKEEQQKQQQQQQSSSEGISSDMERAVEKATDDMAKPQQQTAAAVPAEVDTPRKWLLEVANQLRDDAFVIMAQLSAHLDLFDVDSAISWPIFDALLHWSVSSDVQARDPLPPFGAVSPRHYALEILCKMSVMERNVDLLVSTGSWLRLEAFVRLLCAQICEEPPVREFAIVILNAVCAASEPACYVAAVETPLLEHLVSFLEAADANMTQIVQQQGMHALRENPEIIGTSVGMLRRATTIMVQIAKHEQCREHFRRLQHRLLQFTVSHFMDLRVAAMVANILFEIQRDSVSAAEAKRGGGESGGTTTTADQARKEGHLPSGPPPVVGEDVERKATECLAPAPFMLGSDRNALFNGTCNVSFNQQQQQQKRQLELLPLRLAPPHPITFAAAAATVYVPPMVMVKQEKKDENANACGHDHVDNDDKADTNKRKRVHSNNNSNNNNNNHYDESNGHAGGGGRRTVTRTPDASVGSVDELPVEKRPRMNDDANTPPPMMSMNNNNSTTTTTTTTSSVKVRERMRHNILSKKASLKAAAASAEVMAASPLHPKRNGWIAAVGAADGHCDEQQQQQQQQLQRQQTKKMLHNGIGTESGKSGEAMPTQNASTSPAASSGGGAGGSSLTAVA
uniref:ARID domain-containing protein n=1 Tax=Globodera rostochiensis TaxID=31243 RepID=A0A914I9K1_GLORO